MNLYQILGRYADGSTHQPGTPKFSAGDSEVWEIERLKLLNELERRRQDSESLADLREQISRLEEENQDLREKLFEAREAIEEVQDAEMKFRSEKSSDPELEAELTQTKKNLDAKNVIIRNQSAEIAALTGRIATLSEEVARGRVKAAEWEDKALELSRQLDSQYSTLSSVKVLEEKLKSAEDSWSEAERKLRQVRDELQGANQKIAVFEATMQERERNREREVKAADEEMARVVKSLDSTRKSVKDQKEESDRVREDLRRAQSERDSLRAEIKRLEESLERAREDARRHEGDRRAEKDGFGEEMRKLLALNNQQLEMLRQENKDLEERVMREIRKRQEEEERARLKEHAMHEEIERLETSKKSAKSKKSKHNTSIDSNDWDRQLTIKQHEVIDLTAENNQLCARINHLESELTKQQRRNCLLEEECRFAKEKTGQLLEKVKFYQTADSIHLKTDLEIVKELNDLRENILNLKDERDKILRHLNEQGMDTRKQIGEISTDAFLGHIQKLTMEKRQLGEVLQQREAELASLNMTLSASINREKTVEEDCNTMRIEVNRVYEECDRLRRRADEKEKDATRSLEMLTQRENEFAADLQEKELLLKANVSERDRLIQSLAEMSRTVSKYEQDNAEAIQFHQEVNKALKEKFAGMVGELKSGDLKRGDETLPDLVQKLIDRTNLVAQKDAKLIAAEDKNKKAATKMSQLKKEVKSLKQLENETISKNILAAIQASRSSSKKNNPPLDLQAVIRVFEEATSSNDKSSKFSSEVDALHIELQASQATLRKKEAEVMLLNERLLILEVERNQAKEDARLAEREQKRLVKETKKTAKMYTDEIAGLAEKMVGRREVDHGRDESRVEELTQLLREKKEEISSLKDDALKKKEALEEVRRNKADLEVRVRTLESELSEASKELNRLKVKLEVSSKKDDQLKMYRDSANTLKVERDQAKQELESVKNQIHDLKAEINRKESSMIKLKETSKFSKEKEEALDKMEKSLAESKQTIKKLKADLERKDTVINTLTSKSKEFDGKLEEEKAKMDAEVRQTKKSVLVKNKEIEELKSNKREIMLLEQQLGIMMMVLRKLFKENLKTLYLDGKVEDRSDELAKFKESMNILDLDAGQLKDFISVATQKRMDQARNVMDEEIDKFEKELAAGDELNGNKLYKMLTEVIEDRLHQPQK